MRSILALAAALTVASFVAPSAEAARRPHVEMQPVGHWCAVGESVNCGFQTLAQCMATASGDGDTCIFDTNRS